MSSFEGLLNSIESGFSNLLPSNFCVPCFIKGAVEGAAIGFATLAVIATAPGWLAVALAVGLAALGAYGVYQLATNWSRMSDAAKSEALGGLAGGLLAGRFGPRIPPTSVLVPSGVQYLQTPGGILVPVVATAPAVTTASAVAGAAAAPGLGMAGAAMMSGGGGDGGGGSNNTPSNFKDAKSIPREELTKRLESMGFKKKGESPDGRFVEFVDKENRVRAKIHPPDDQTPYNHLHLYDEEGNSLNADMKPVNRKSQEAHIEIK
jgi:hypothetical protein